MALQVSRINRGHTPLQRILFLSLVLLCCYIAGTSRSNAVGRACGRQLTTQDFKDYLKPAKNMERQIQKHLHAIYRENPDYRTDDQSGTNLEDGVIGPITLGWLNRFCQDLEVDVPLKDVGAGLVDELVKSLAHFGAIARDWRDGFRVSYELTEEFIGQLLGAQKALEAISKLKGQSYPTRQALWRDVEENLSITSDPSRFRKLVEKYASQGVMLTQKSFDALKQDKVNIPNLQKLETLKEVLFVGREKLVAKLKSTDIISSDDADFYNYYKAILSAAEQVYSLTSDSIEKIRNELGDQDGIQEVVSAFQPLFDVEYSNRALFLAALRMTLNNQPKESQALILNNDVYRKMDIITTLARRDHGAYQKRVVDWNGNSCGCVLDDLSGTVYGFYPFWLASGTEQHVDFSVLSRIGYQAVTFDGQGEIPELRHWQLAGADFVDQARRHRTKVDLVVYKPWAEFVTDVASNKFLLDKITTRLTELVAEKLTSSWFNVIKPYVSFGLKPTPSLGDGITLYLDGYPTDSLSSQLFTDFIKLLRKKLKAIDPQLNLNVIISLWSIETKPYLRDALTHLVPTVEQYEKGYQGQNDVDLFLVFLREPSSNSKKTLRRAVENIFVRNDPETSDIRAIQRRNFLRKIIPIMIYNGQDPKQLTADLTYFEDNFGGAGFWPMPITDTGGSGTDLAQNINFALKTTFVTHQPGKRNSDIALVHFFQEKIAQVLSLVNHWVCENRWTVRIIFDVLLIGLIVSLYLYFGKCKPSCAKWAIGLIILTAITGLMLLFFDPAYKEMSKGNALLIILILCNIGYLLFRYRKNQAQLP